MLGEDHVLDRREGAREAGGALREDPSRGALGERRAEVRAPAGLADREGHGEAALQARDGVRPAGATPDHLEDPAVPSQAGDDRADAPFRPGEASGYSGERSLTRPGARARASGRTAARSRRYHLRPKPRPDAATRRRPGGLPSRRLRSPATRPGRPRGAARADRRRPSTARPRHGHRPLRPSGHRQAEQTP